MNGDGLRFSWKLNGRFDQMHGFNAVEHGRTDLWPCGFVPGSTHGATHAGASAHGPGTHAARRGWSHGGDLGWLRGGGAAEWQRMSQADDVWEQHTKYGSNEQL